MSAERNPFARFLTKHRKGDVLFQEGDEGDTMFIIQSGTVAIKKSVAGGGEVQVAMMEKGDFFGEMTILERQPRSAKAEMLEDGALIAINSETFGEMLRSNPEIAVRMLRKYSLRLREMDHLLETMGAEPPARPQVAAAPPVPPVPAPAAQAPAMAPAAEPAPFAFLVSKTSGVRYPVVKNEALLGRFDSVTGTHPDVDLTKEENSRNISRRHARLLRKDGKFFLAEEIGAMNGTFINGQRLANGVMNVLSDGDEIMLCRVGLLFRLPN
jgi:CRP-like cAMP-binding protein